MYGLFKLLGINWMDKKPRIAFCFSGQARTLDQTYIFFQKNLFDAAKEQGFDYDIFCAVEDDKDVDKVELLNPTKIEKIKSGEVENFIYQHHKMFIGKCLNKNYCFVHEKNFLNFLQQLYKVSESISLEEDYKNRNDLEYSLVVRIRFDRPLFNKINFSKIKYDIKDNEIICIEPKINWPYGSFLHISDCFFVGTEKSIHCLRNIFNNIEECFNGHEVKIVGIRNLFTRIKNGIEKFNNSQKLVHIPITGILFVESTFYTVFTPEMCYEIYFYNNSIRIIKYKFSNIIFRKNIELSGVHLFKKNKYEL